MLAGDGISDMTPGLGVAGWPFPVHQIGIVGMGLHLIDNVDLSRLAPECAAATSGSSCSPWPRCASRAPPAAR